MEYGATSSEKAQRRAARKSAKESKSGNHYEPLKPKTETQQFYMTCLREDKQVFAIGGAGTGKTYIAARHALKELVAGRVERVVVARPMVAQARHRMGFLPGGAAAKMKPWLIPIFDAFKKEAAASVLEQLTSLGKVECVSFEHIRGRTFDNAIIILDEAQNCTLHDLQTFLTRVGENAQIIVCGDTDQCDIEDSGLSLIVDMIDAHGIDASIVEFGPEDVVRSAVAKEWVMAFAARKEAGL